MSEENVYPRPPRISGASQRGLVAAMLLSTALSSITRDRLKSHTCPGPLYQPQNLKACGSLAHVLTMTSFSISALERCVILTKQRTEKRHTCSPTEKNTWSDQAIHLTM